MHATSEQLFKIGDQASRKPRGRISSDVDEKIHIAIGTPSPPGDGTEETNIASSVPGGDGQDLGAAPP